MKVLVACEESQEVCKAFRARGHDAYSCDIQECSGGHPEWHIMGDCLPLLVDIVKEVGLTKQEISLVIKKYAKPTNADRIRSMSDEELAWELARICRMPFYKDDSEIDEYEVDCWAKWLKQEADNGEDN